MKIIKKEGKIFLNNKEIQAFSILNNKIKVYNKGKSITYSYYDKIYLNGVLLK